jgi:hypothetical protein
VSALGVVQLPMLPGLFTLWGATLILVGLVGFVIALRTRSDDVLKAVTLVGTVGLVAAVSALVIVGT